MEKKVFIIAEISANHGHDIEIVKKTILKAKEIGVDAVKIQTYKPETMTLDCDCDDFVISDEKSLWYKSKLFDLYKEGMLDWQWHEELFDFARKNDIILFSTPFDKSAVDLLEECHNPIYKIASFEINDLPLIEYAASKQKPMIISTGIATLEEIENAIKTCHSVGNYDVTILKCTSEYPAKLEDANLIMISDFIKRFNVKVGLSDHTESNIPSIVSIALGAKVIEKHFILDKKIGGPDASFSLEPDEFKKLIEEVRDAEKSLGKVDYTISEKKQNSRQYRRSLYISKDVKAGEIISDLNIKSVRPGFGLDPKFYHQVIGKKFKEDFVKGTPLSLEIIE